MSTHRSVRFLPFLVCVAIVVMPAHIRADDIAELPVARTLTFSQLSAPVDVVRDSFGVPHVYASTFRDAAFVLGYVHATDRLFQMDIFRRIPSGTVSEVLGFPDLQVGSLGDPTAPPFPGNIDNVIQDLFFQTLGLRRAAVDSFNALSPELQSALQAYADGVNEVITLVNATGNLPPEYAALKITHIEPWVPVDSVVFGKLQALELSFDFDDGLTGDLADVTTALGAVTGKTAFYEDLARSQPAENAFTVPDANGTPIPLTGLSVPKQVMLAGAAVTEGTSSKCESVSTLKGGDELAITVAGAVPAKAQRRATAEHKRAAMAARKATLAKARELIAKLMRQPALRAIRERGVVGSNEWAVDGSITDTGNPILANDPHLGLGSPSTFYELHVNTKDRGGDINVTGIGFSAAPGVVLGHNEHIAWGATTNPTDVTDWYLENISSDGSGNLYSHYNGTPEPLTELPLQVKVNVDNGNLTGTERPVLNGALGLPLYTQLSGVVDVTPMLAQFVPPKVLIVGRHGPIFPQTLQPYPFPNNHSGGSALSIQFTGLYATRELETFFLWNRATNLAEFKDGLRFFDFGSQNWAYADTAGNIAYFSSGEFPIREDIAAGAVAGNPPWVIRDGTGGNEWKALGGPQPADQAVPYEVVPAANMPQIENPSQHFFVNANNDPIGNTADNDPLDDALAGTAPYLSFGYDDFRAARITELIKSELNLIPPPPGTPAGDGTISFADMQRMQADVNQLDGRRLSGYFVTAVDNAQAGGAPPELAGLVNPRIIEARSRLAAWTFNTPAGFDTTGDPGIPSAQELIDSVATTIYNVALGRLMVNTFDAKLAASGIDYRQGSNEGIRGLLRILDKVPFTGVGASGLNFFDDPSVTLPAADERDMLMVKSLQQALDLLAGAAFADAYANSLNVDDYLWGKVHYVIFESFIDGDLNDTRIAGGGAFSLPPQPAVGFPPGHPTDGGRFTVDVANHGLRPASDTGLSFGSGPNRRSVVEMGASGPVRARNVIPGGDDGVLGRPGFGNQIDLWLSNGTHDTLLATADVVADAASRDAFPDLPGCTDSAPGRCIPGRGSAKTDCIAEFFVDAPVDATAITRARVTVTDGSGSDRDGSVNGACAVHVLFCVNNNDPRVLSRQGEVCQSPDVDLFHLRSPRPDSRRPEDQANGAAILAAVRSLGPSVTTGDHDNVIDFEPALTSQDACAGTYVVVPIRNGRPTKKMIRIRVTRTDGTKDLDALRITCAP